MSIDQESFLEGLKVLADFNSTPELGISRFSYTKEDSQAREWLQGQCSDLGMSMRTDDIGNIFVRLEGSDPELLPVATGSHLDSVQNGGRLDGALGVVAGLEVLRALQAKGGTKRSVDLIVFAEEEGSNFGPTCFGSRFLTGHFEQDDLHRLKRFDGQTAYEVLSAYGLKPELADDVAKNAPKYHGFVELHIEQSQHLENAGCSLGLVEAIAGRHLLKIHLKGEANHAGSTPMRGRRDALVTAAEIICESNNVGLNLCEEETVLTIGSIEVSPNSPNVIAGEVAFSVDIRAVDNDEMAKVHKAVVDIAERISSKADVEMREEVLSESNGVRIDGSIVEVVSAAIAKEGKPAMNLISGAVHDAAYMADLGPAGMIFVPSINGISHNAAEDTKDEDIIAGANALFYAMESLAS